MGHSYITGKEIDFLVRESTFEVLLEKILDNLNETHSDHTTISLVQGWHDYWHEMPPGCKMMALECNTPNDLSVLKKALDSLMPSLKDNEGLLRVANAMTAILHEDFQKSANQQNH